MTMEEKRNTEKQEGKIMKDEEKMKMEEGLKKKVGRTKMEE